MDTFLVPSDAVRIFSKDNALNLACSPNIFTKSLFRPTQGKNKYRVHKTQCFSKAGQEVQQWNNWRVNK
jgi:hypothetical protein